MKKVVKKIELLMELGGIKKDITFLIISGIALIISIFELLPLPFDAAWISIILCGLPIIMEAVIGLVTAFDIKADVLVSLALVASVCIGEDFAAGEGVFEIYTVTDDLYAIKEVLEGAGYPILSAEPDKIPTTTVALTDPDDLKFMGLLIDTLEDDDDVMDVYHNWES